MADTHRRVVPQQANLTDLLEISDLLLEHGKIRLRIASWSMYPTLRPGDLIQAEPADASQIPLGDLVLFHASGQLFCHRLVDRHQEGESSWVVTKGDQTTQPDEPIEATRVLGQVVHIERNGRLLTPDESSGFLSGDLGAALLSLMYYSLRGVRLEVGRLLRKVSPL